MTAEFGVGDEVVEFAPSTRNGSRGGRIERTSVKSIGKRDLVLVNGSRYRVGSTTRYSGEGWSRSSIHLLRPDDDRIPVALRANKASNAYAAARAATDAFLRKPSVETATVLSDALSRFITHREAADADA